MNQKKLIHQIAHIIYAELKSHRQENLDIIYRQPDDTLTPEELLCFSYIGFPTDDNPISDEDAYKLILDLVTKEINAGKYIVVYTCGDNAELSITDSAHVEANPDDYGDMLTEIGGTQGKLFIGFD